MRQRLDATVTKTKFFQKASFKSDDPYGQLDFYCPIIRV